MYVTTPASYLFMRVLKQLVMDEKDNFAIVVANIVLQDVYLDDILTGCSNLKELQILKSELVQLCESVEMSLHRWCFSQSNSHLPDHQLDQLPEENTGKA
ncbi:uncharacterized protein NPIL_54391 [Nephila pilipes]|uniref:Reverse transcriptase n=1 Tax=Nephila pilipes TaxID=299642 RepID=A0A8X6IPE3_NEPPI|nr:uncharacterized protein NPIL_54391 [Nephila pilipes]